MDNTKKLIGLNINAALAKEKKMQKELAKELGVSDNVVSYFTSGERTPNAEQIIKIARFLNVSTDSLLGTTEIKATDSDTSLNNLPSYIPSYIEIMNTLYKGGFMMELVEHIQTFLLYQTDGECILKVEGHSEPLDITVEFAEWQLNKNVITLISKIRDKLCDNTLNRILSSEEDNS